jgi:hypothetical protein
LLCTANTFNFYHVKIWRSQHFQFLSC